MGPSVLGLVINASKLANEPQNLQAMLQTWQRLATDEGMDPQYARELQEALDLLSSSPSWTAFNEALNVMKAAQSLGMSSAASEPTQEPFTQRPGSPTGGPGDQRLKRLNKFISEYSEFVGRPEAGEPLKVLLLGNEVDALEREGLLEAETASVLKRTLFLIDPPNPSAGEELYRMAYPPWWKRLFR